MNHDIVIVGVGALGSHVALLGRNWVTPTARLTLIDFDKVEQKNTQSQLHTKMALRRNKAQALGQALRGMFGVSTRAVPNKLSADNVDQLLGDATLILDCTDNIATRALIQSFAKDRNVPCLHGALSADGNFGQCVWTETFTPDSEGLGAQATCEDGEHLPFFALVAAQMATAAQRFLNSGERRGYQVSPGGTRRVT